MFLYSGRPTKQFTILWLQNLFHSILNILVSHLPGILIYKVVDELGFVSLSCNIPDALKPGALSSLTTHLRHKLICNIRSVVYYFRGLEDNVSCSYFHQLHGLSVTEQVKQ